MAARCRDGASSSGVRLGSAARPCPWPIIRLGEHAVDLQNNRPNSVYDLEVHARSRQAIVQMVPRSGAGPQPEVIKLYPVISAGGSKSDAFALSTAIVNAGQTVEMATTITYYDATQRTATGYTEPGEAQRTLYELDLT